MIEIIDEQLTMPVGILVIPPGINEQEKWEEDASEDADGWELQNVTLAKFIVKQKGIDMILRKERRNHPFEQ
jgi:hypothetical protein